MMSKNPKKCMIVKLGLLINYYTATEYKSPRAHLHSLHIHIWEDVISRHCTMQRPIR